MDCSAFVGVSYGSETARVIRKRSSMAAEGADYFSAYFPFTIILKMNSKYFTDIPPGNYTDHIAAVY